MCLSDASFTVSTKDLKCEKHNYYKRTRTYGFAPSCDLCISERAVSWVSNEFALSEADAQRLIDGLDQKFGIH